MGANVVLQLFRHPDIPYHVCVLLAEPNTLRSDEHYHQDVMVTPNDGDEVIVL